MFKSAALAAFHHQAVHAGLDGADGGFQRGHDVKHGQARLFERGAIFAWVAGRGGDEFDALVGDEIDDAGVAHEGLGDIDAEGFCSELAHAGDFVAYGIELAGRGFDDAHAAGVGDGGGELRAGDPAHGRLDDGQLDIEELRDAVGNHVCSLGRLVIYKDRACSRDIRNASSWPGQAPVRVPGCFC